MSGDDETPILPRGASLERAQIVELQNSQREMRGQLAQITQALERLAVLPPPQREDQQRRRIDHASDDEYEDTGGYNRPVGNQQFRHQRSNVKMKIPSFKGSSSPEEYLEWVQRVEKVFECEDYSEAMKVKLAALEFTDYANIWWENVKSQRRYDGEEEIRNWRIMKRVMEKRFVPQYYKQELYIKMQSLRQGALCVEDYVKEFEMLMIRCDLREPQEQTIARFLGGLQKEIADCVELQSYVFLDDVIKLAVKVERQRKRGVSRLSKPTSSPSPTAWITPKPIYSLQNGVEILNALNVLEMVT